MARRRTRTKRSVFETNPKLDLIVTIIGGCSLLISMLLFLFLPMAKLNQSGLFDIKEFIGFEVIFGDNNILSMSVFNLITLILLAIGVIVAFVKVRDKRYSLIAGFVSMIASIMIPFSGKMIFYTKEFNLIGVGSTMVFGPYVAVAFSLIGALCLLAVSVNANFDKYM